MSRLYVRGMHGLGDNLHQRGVLRQLAERHDEIWLETSWPSVYHDMPAIRCVAKGTSLRTQLKNARRQAGLFRRAPAIGGQLRIWYAPQDVRHTGSVLAAMCANAGVDPERADFRLPVPQEWSDQARRIVGATDRPILVYRPLVERTEWGGCRARNPETRAYAELFARVRERYFVVSVADLVPRVEWMVSEPIQADATFHAGELHFEALVGLFSLASLVWCSPGFAAPLAQAVGTPVVCVFGGYESSRSFSLGARFTPYLGIDPIEPCECFQHQHSCRKAIDLAAAAQRVDEFMSLREAA
jgi:hypothetical protein